MPGSPVKADDITTEQVMEQASSSLQLPQSPATYALHSRSSTSPVPTEFNDDTGVAEIGSLPRSQSGNIETPSISTSPYSSLQYAPRQKSNLSTFRPSQSSFQSHSSLWKQQQQQQQQQQQPSPSIDPVNADPQSPSLLSAFPNSTASISSPVLSTLAIEGVSNNIEQTKSNADQISAAENLAKQQLRADAEDMGVRVGSLGWAILDRIQSAPNADWAELGEMLSRGEATLLLPTSPLHSREVNLSQVYNHIIFSTVQSSPPNIFSSSVKGKGKGKETHSLLTFKGLRADLIDDEDETSQYILQIKSFLPRENMKFVSQLKSSSKRADLFDTLSPLPGSSAGSLPLSPSFQILGHYTNLLLPPSLSRKDVSGSIRSRSGSSATLLTPEQKQVNRASATFATLFGGRRDKRASFLGIVDDSKELKEMNDIGSEEAASGSNIQVVQPTRSITVAVIDGEIRRSQVLHDLTAGMKARIKQRLTQSEGRESIPNDIIEVVCSFAAMFFPPTSTSSKAAESRSISTDSELLKSPNHPTLQAPFLYSPDQLADSFQDFYTSIKTQLEQVDGGGLNVEQGLQQVESVVCSEVFDRIFCPYTSLDIYHDEALFSRIITLNEVGINLHHLGLKLDATLQDERTITIRSGLEDIVKKCGLQLQTLGERQCCSPGDKLGVLVSAHKDIVEGLAKLPKIELDDEEDTTAKSKNGIEGATQEGREKASSSTSSADLILPILIYCIIKSNPPRLASNLLYIQRYHAEALVKGEASYCLVNVQAAVAFLENVEPASLGLDTTVHLVTANEVEQERRTRYVDGLSPTVEQTNTLPMPTRMRDRVAHDVGELAGMSNRVITGVLGSSLGAFGRMMGAGTTYAMGIDPNTGTPRTSTNDVEGQKRHKSIDDIRGILSGGAAAKLGSVLNKVVAIENEGKITAPRDIAADSNRPKLVARRSTNSSRPPTDYGAEVDERRSDQASSANSTGKTSITDRLASLPLLSRSANTSSSLPPPLSSTRAELEPPSPTVPSKDLPPRSGPLRVDSYKSSHSLNSLGSHMDSSTLHSPINNTGIHQHIPASLRSPFPPLSYPPTRERPLHVVLASTGSVASIKIPLMIEKLMSYENVRIQVISTKSSSHFYDRKTMSASLQPYTVEDLANEIRQAGQKDDNDYPSLHFWTDEDEWDQWKQIGDSILHIELRRWADIVLIAPCSANTLAKINAGICDDLLTSFLRALSPTTPTYLFPAMNTLMFMHPLTARHLDFAANVLGYHIIGPIEKRLACGDLGQGAMQEWSEIVELVVRRYSLIQSTAQETATS